MITSSIRLFQVSLLLIVKPNNLTLDSDFIVQRCIVITGRGSTRDLVIINLIKLIILICHSLT